MKKFAVTTLLLLFAATALGEAPKLVLRGPTKVRAGVPLIVSAKKSTGIETCEWSVAGHEDIMVMTLDDRDLIAYVVFDAPGIYDLTLTATGAPPSFDGPKKDAQGKWTDAYVAWLEAAAFKPSTDEASAVLKITVDAGVSNPYPAPLAAVRSRVEPLSQFKLQRADALSLAVMYNAASQANLATTLELREYCVGEGKKLALKGKYDGLANAVDAAWNDLIGLKNRALTPSDKAALGGFAWAVWQTGWK